MVTDMSALSLAIRLEKLASELIDPLRIVLPEGRTVPYNIIRQELVSLGKQLESTSKLLATLTN